MDTIQSRSFSYGPHIWLKLILCLSIGVFNILGMCKLVATDFFQLGRRGKGEIVHNMSQYCFTTTNKHTCDCVCSIKETFMQMVLNCGVLLVWITLHGYVKQVERVCVD